MLGIVRCADETSRHSYVVAITAQSVFTANCEPAFTTLVWQRGSTTDNRPAAVSTSLTTSRRYADSRCNRGCWTGEDYVQFGAGGNGPE